MKKAIIIVIVLLNTITTYAQIGRLDTLTESKRNEILLKAFKDKLLKESYLKAYYNDTDSPIIYDLGTWKDGDHLKLGISNIKSLIGRRLYAVGYLSSEEAIKYYPRLKHKVIVLYDSEGCKPLYSTVGPSHKAITEMREFMHRRDSLRQLRLEYLEKEKRLKKMEDSIGSDKLKIN